ncbi:DUF3089 domain-containing protein [Hirschia litorea]|uniref:DUF3089 domain-containing protein n=1 Tax=Hirschia litorea TaxID=1199156 RepID=A0ABW2II85_9PROT
MVHEQQPEQKSGSPNSSQPSYARHLNPRFPYLAVGALILAIVGVFSTIWYLSGAPQRYMDAITPTSSYTLPKSDIPDYLDTSSWAIIPTQKPEGAWETPWGVDVFFVHSTTSNSAARWNIPIDSVDARLKLKADILPNYAAPFAASAPVYAPYYRQATLFAELHASSNSEKALTLAYGDVEAAFKTYMSEHNQGRAIIIAGVGQGGLHAQRLIKDHFQTEDMKRLFVAGYLIETPTTKDFASENVSGFEPCHTDEQIHCIASWNTIYENDGARTQNILSRTLEWTDDNAIVSSPSKELLCFNPSMGGSSSELVAPKLHRGSANTSNLADGQAPTIIEAAIASQCVGGFLVVSKPSEKSLRMPENQAAKSMTPAYNLFYSDVVFDAAKRARIASAWLDKNAPKPAPPLPPIETIEIAPIQKIEKILDTP